jgi:hypothetical protein
VRWFEIELKSRRAERTNLGKLTWKTHMEKRDPHGEDTGIVSS